MFKHKSERVENRLNTGMKLCSLFAVIIILTLLITPLTSFCCDDIFYVNRETLADIGKYITGQNTDGFEDGDYNKDGITDVFDVIKARKYVSDYTERCPEGMWVGTGTNGVRFFWFDGEYGVIFNGNGTTQTEFTPSVDNCRFSFGCNGGYAMADIVWNDDNSFTLYWDEYGFENFTFIGYDRIEPNSKYTGEYIADSDNGKCKWTFNGYTGKCGDDEFCWFPCGKDMKILWNNNPETSEVVKTVWTDKYHFTMAHSDRNPEYFTRQEITNVNGVTYINGILIANKTYSLPSTYNPGGLTSETSAAVNEMIKAAAGDGLDLWVTSGFRSYSYQAMLYNDYVNRDGKTLADTYSARPGHSEHQTGLAADMNYAGSAFDSTPQAAWLEKNCYKFGFIIRYPKNKQNITGYKYESWHIRYLGKELARLVYDSGLTLEEYLGIDSVYSY